MWQPWINSDRGIGKLFYQIRSYYSIASVIIIIIKMFIADNNRPERNNVIPDELDDNFQFDNHITNDIGKVQIYDY
jgi:hypothetical protein